MTDDANMLRDASFELNAGEVDAGERVDRFLALNLEGISRARVQALIRAGHVTLAGEAVGDPSARVKVGERYVVVVPEPVAAEPVGEPMALEILFEDADLIVIDKAAGMVVHPSAGHDSGTLVHALIAHCGDNLSGIGGVKRPGIVHRLDKDTTGVLVVAKSDRAHLGLAEQFAAHGRDGRLSRAYLGVCWRVPGQRRGTIDAPLGRSRINRRKMAVVSEKRGRHAVTHYTVERTFAGLDGQDAVSLLRLELETGRTHQIRVHLAHIHQPLLGDPVYGAGFKASARGLSLPAQEALEALGRQALHAEELSFEHPASGERMSFRAEVPADLARLIEAL